MSIYNPECEGCPLHEGAPTRCLAARMPDGTPLDILFVGEAPMFSESKAGSAFSGLVYPYMKAMVEALTGKRVGMTYAVKCPAPAGKKPGVKAMRACRDLYLDREIEEYAPEWIVPMGNIALNAVMGVTGITKWAGREAKSDRYPNARIFPMLSPLVLASEAAKDQHVRFDADFTRFHQILTGTTPAVDYPRMEDPAEIDAWIEANVEDMYSIDLETTGLNPRFAGIRTFAIAAGPGKAIWVPYNATKHRRVLLRLLLSGKVMVAHNATFECRWLLHHVVAPLLGDAEARRTEWRVLDSLLLHYLLDTSAPHDLSGLAKQFTDIGGYDDEVESLKARLGAGIYQTTDIDVIGRYNAGDADACFRLAERFWEQCVDDGMLHETYARVLEPAIWAVVEAEYHGRRVDPEAVIAVRTDLLADEAAALRTIRASRALQRYETDHGPINLRSASQVATWLVDYEGLRIEGRTDSGAVSVQEKWLKPFLASSSAARAYVAWKKARTLENNYLGTYSTRSEPGSGFLRFVAPNGFLYGSYLLFGTDTGRLASRSPNLQNFHQTLRRVVRSRFPGGKIVEADYSQLELRIIAWQSGCKALLEAYERGDDVHRLTASLILGRPLEDITADERQKFGKIPNFGLTYGMYPKRFAAEFQVSLEEAKFIHRQWHAAYPEISAYVESIQGDAEVFGEIRTHTGRIRRLPDAMLDITGHDRKSDAFKRFIRAKLAASNTPTQSLGSDLNTISAAAVRRRLAAEGMQTLLIGLTHDSGTYDAPASEVERLTEILHKEMIGGIEEKFPEIGVPLAIDIKQGPSWGEKE